MEENKELPCADKMVFDSKDEAEATAAVAHWQHGGKLRAYQCRYCHLWHLATKTES